MYLLDGALKGIVAIMQTLLELLTRFGELNINKISSIT